MSTEEVVASREELHNEDNKEEEGLEGTKQNGEPCENIERWTDRCK